MQTYEQLGNEDKKTLAEVPVLITFLIAGSDNNIDDEEREWAQKLIEFRASRNETLLVQYYNSVEKAWEDNFQKYASILVDYEEVEMRNNYISDLLSNINPILAKLEPGFATLLYNNFRSFAKQVAQASGGLWGFGSISPEENEWLELEMIDNPEAKA